MTANHTERASKNINSHAGKGQDISLLLYSKKYHILYTYFYIESFAVINLRGVSTNKTIICFIAMQTYKELITSNVETITNEFFGAVKKFRAGPFNRDDS
jgi:hypothetical protein